MSAFTRHIDAALEWSVVGSFTRVGSALRRRFNHWTPLEGMRIDGRVIVMSGATSGLGAEAARAFAEMGATLEIIARNAGKADKTCAELREQTGNPNIRFVLADTGDLAALRRAAAEISERHPLIHVLIHNAGALDDHYRASLRASSSRSPARSWDRTSSPLCCCPRSKPRGRRGCCGSRPVECTASPWRPIACR